MVVFSVFHSAFYFKCETAETNAILFQLCRYHCVCAAPSSL